MNEGVSYSFSAGVGMEPATKTPEVEVVLRELEKEVDRLYESLKGLEARIDPILIPSVPSINKDVALVSATGNPHSQLFNRLEGLRWKLTDNNVLISNIKARLEV